MGYGIIIQAQGSYALFTRPEMKVERVSYDFITPSAARGILEAIYWKPAIRWVIDKIHVLNEIKFTNIRRNEMSQKISTDNVNQAMNNGQGNLYLSSNDTRQQRAALVLQDVNYVIEAHFDSIAERWGEKDSVEGHYNIILRRLRNGQHFHAPYLGTREFPAHIELIEDQKDIPKSILTGSRDFGWMLYDMDFSNLENIRPIFFHAQMIDGIVDFRQVEVKQ